ncbi:alpha/beta fold hydrolase [Pseudooceanicola onchidii]|uniref:alpha/beta fold hydrolase n=1 Tax=Pseudooceanicola onchidii TaxID=2562279 RepID=UPI0010AB4303|nr:alpha/beta hydrolase [Pseudooceanicola onchidii]
MTQPSHAFIPVMDHEIHVTTWGDPSNPALVMWHGLARTGRDFDDLAADLSEQYFVLCPDTIGRGLSSWSADPEREYSLEYYSGIAADLLDAYGIDRTGWIGTSMGGLIGMHMASGPLAARLDWLVINDIGPEVPQDAIDRILAYADQSPEFRTLTEVEAWLRAAYAPFGSPPDPFWTRMARTSVRRKANGMFTTHYDPKITVQFTASPQEFRSWDRFTKITLPMHLIGGADSDLLTQPIIAKMQALQPQMGTTIKPGMGHAPSLSEPGDTDLIRGIIATLT